jgi:glutamate-1-semialdehyde 2,1-aminomutase
VPTAVARLGSMFWLALLTDTAPRAAERIHSGAAEVYRAVFHALLADGIALAPSAYEIGFLSLAHSRADVERLAASLGSALAAAEVGSFVA